MAKNLGLANLLAALRQELEKAQEEVAKSTTAPLLALRGAEVEIQFAVEKGGEAGVNLLFIPVEIGGSYKAENLHRIRLTLDSVSPVGVAGSGSGK